MQKFTELEGNIHLITNVYVLVNTCISKFNDCETVIETGLDGAKELCCGRRR